MDWIRELTDEELSSTLQGDAQIIYIACGIETLVQIYKNLSGINIYISKSSVREAMKLYVCKHFNGMNHKELAIRLGITERCVYDLINEARKNNDKNKSR